MQTKNYLKYRIVLLFKSRINGTSEVKVSKIVFLASGEGGNLKLFHNFITLNNLEDCKVAGVICDRECGASEFAGKNEIPRIILPDFKRDINSCLKGFDFDFAFTGIHKKIPEVCLDNYGAKLLNVHYSLLPKYRGTIGMTAVIEAMKNKDKKIGATIHRLTSELDAGPQINQGWLENHGNHMISEIRNSVFRIGFMLLLNEILDTNKLIFTKTTNFKSSEFSFYFRESIKQYNSYKSDSFWKI